MKTAEMEASVCMRSSPPNVSRARQLIWSVFTFFFVSLSFVLAVSFTAGPRCRITKDQVTAYH